MAEGEIPASVIAAHTSGWAYDDAAMFEHCIRQMDRVYLRRGEPPETDDAGASPQEAFRGVTANRRGR